MTVNSETNGIDKVRFPQIHFYTISVLIIEYPSKALSFHFPPIVESIVMSPSRPCHALIFIDTQETIAFVFPC